VQKTLRKKLNATMIEISILHSFYVFCMAAIADSQLTVFSMFFYLFIYFTVFDCNIIK